MDIATVDRDEIPLRFDENVRDFDYFKAKIIRLIDSKLRILFPLLGEDNVDKALERVYQFANQYQRVSILKFDPKSSSSLYGDNPPPKYNIWSTYNENFLVLLRNAVLATSRLPNSL